MEVSENLDPLLALTVPVKMFGRTSTLVKTFAGFELDWESPSLCSLRGLTNPFSAPDIRRLFVDRNRGLAYS